MIYICQTDQTQSPDKEYKIAIGDHPEQDKLAIKVCTGLYPDAVLIYREEPNEEGGMAVVWERN